MWVTMIAAMSLGTSTMCYAASPSVIEHHAVSTHTQNAKLRVTRTERGSTGWKWMSSTPAAGSPGSREA